MQQRVILGRMEKHIGGPRDMAVLKRHGCWCVPGFKRTLLRYQGRMRIVRRAPAEAMRIAVVAVVKVLLVDC